VRRAPLILVAVVGVLLVVFARVYSAVRSLSAVRTGDDALDRFVGTLTRSLMLRTRGTARPEQIRACLSIISNETGGRAAPQIGDATLSGGPSVGPMQVYRSTAKSLGLWTPPPGADEPTERELYSELATDEAGCVDMGVAVFLDKLRAAGGDI
jgi:hypothetical protein